MKRILIYCHFNNKHKLSPHVIYQLNQIQPLFDRIIIVSNSLLSQESIMELSEITTEIIQRDNVGYDFAAWRDALDYASKETLKNYDSLTLMNDTCFGPIFSLEEAYQKMENSNLDFWGMTKIEEIPEGIPEIGISEPVKEHIQSYFTVFNNSVLKSETFYDFWKSVEDFEDVNDVIKNYEVKFTNILASSGYTYDALYNLGSVPNAAIANSDRILSGKVPFLKIKALEGFTYQRTLASIIEEKSNYPTELIEQFLVDYKSWAEVKIASTFNKLLPRQSTSQNSNITQTIAHNNIKVAIHLHVFYLDIMEEFLDQFDTIELKSDLFITTDSHQKKDEIDRLSKDRGLTNLREIIVVPNLGRDIIPWISISDRLNKYDIVGKFHTKKSETIPETESRGWRQDIQESLIGNSSEIVEQMTINKNLGIVIPDVPQFFRYIAPNYSTDERAFTPMLQKLWEKMNLPAKSFDDESTFIYSIGTMFWYRPRALEPLTSLRFSDDEIPQEPLKMPYISILHAIERAPIYVSRSQGYSYAISPHNRSMSAFVDNTKFNSEIFVKDQVIAATNVQLEATSGELQSLKYSTSYKLGVTLTATLRFLKRIFSRR
jgi:rhamnosyltransferase